jgi:hypothetical protein
VPNRTVRRRGTPRQMAYQRIGDWPDGLGRPGAGREHAWMAWTTARAGVLNRSEGLWEHVDGDVAGYLGQVDLAFLGTLAGHLRRCADCWKDWGGGRPVDLLTKAVRRRPMGAVFQALTTEARELRPRTTRRKR